MAVAQAFGISKILAFDIIPKRTEFAKGFGADYVSLVPPKPEGRNYHEWAEAWKVRALAEAGVDPWGVDVVVEASGAESAMHAGMSFVHMGGTCECFFRNPPLTPCPKSSPCSRRSGWFGPGRDALPNVFRRRKGNRRDWDC